MVPIQTKTVWTLWRTSINNFIARKEQDGTAAIALRWYFVQNVFWSNGLERIGEHQKVFLEQSWFYFRKLQVLFEKSPSKLFFLSSQKQFEQFKEHQSEFFGKNGAKIYSCNFSHKKNRAMFSSYQFKMFGDYQPNFRAKWEQQNEFVFFLRKKLLHCLLLIRSKRVCKKSAIFFRALFELIF